MSVEEETQSPIRQRLKRNTVVVALTGICCGLLVFYFVEVTRSTQANLKTTLTKVDERIAALESFQSSNRIRLSENEAFVLLRLHPARGSAEGKVEYEFAIVSSLEPWTFPTDTSEVTRGVLPLGTDATLQIPVPALLQADSSLLDVRLVIRTDHQVLEKADSPSRLTLVCVGGSGSPQRQILAAHFFQVVQKNLALSTARSSANTCHFAWKHDAKLILELNSESLIASLNRTGTCDLSFRLSHMLAIGSGDE
ncbi:hypothetical protein JYT83_00055 [bacterium AH-315-F18]|nr:hypothetical protein [bacterium AH-315-F18]